MSLVYYLRTISETVASVITGGKVATTATIDASDIELGAVEMKDGTTDTRAKVAATSSVAEGDSALAVQAPVLGATTGAAVITDANGTLQGYLRGLVKLFAARMLTRRRCLNASETVAISGTTAKNATAGLAVGDYLISANVFCFIRQGVWATITSTVAAGTPLFAGESIIVPVTTVGADDGIAAITEGASGALYIKGAEAV